MDIREKFHHKVNVRNRFLTRELSAKMAEENTYEMETEAALLKNLEDNSSTSSKEDLAEIRDNIIQTLLITREEIYIRLLRYVENEEFHVSDDFFFF